MLGLTLTSCVSAAAMADDSGVSVDILVAEGVPYYDANNVFLYYLWNGRYWYRYWYHDSWYYRPYLRPLPPGARPHFHRPGPGGGMHSRGHGGGRPSGGFHGGGGTRGHMGGRR